MWPFVLQVLPFMEAVKPFVECHLGGGMLLFMGAMQLFMGAMQPFAEAVLTRAVPCRLLVLRRVWRRAGHGPGQYRYVLRTRCTLPGTDVCVWATRTRHSTGEAKRRFSRR